MLQEDIAMPPTTAPKQLPFMPPDSYDPDTEARAAETTTPKRKVPSDVPCSYISDLPQFAQHSDVLQAATLQSADLPKGFTNAHYSNDGLEARKEPSGKLRRVAPPIAPHPYGSLSVEQGGNIDVFQAAAEAASQPQEASDKAHIVKSGHKALKPWIESSTIPRKVVAAIDPPQSSVGSASESRHVDVLSAAKALSLPRNQAPDSEGIVLSDRRTVGDRKILSTAECEVEHCPTIVAYEAPNPTSMYTTQIEALPEPVTIRTTKRHVRYRNAGKQHSLRNASTQIAFIVGCVAVTGWTGILIELLGLITGKGISGPVVGYIVLGIVVAYLLLVWRLLLVEKRWMKPLPPVIWTVGLIVASSLVGMVILGIVVGVQHN